MNLFNFLQNILMFIRLYFILKYFSTFTKMYLKKKTFSLHQSLLLKFQEFLWRNKRAKYNKQHTFFFRDSSKNIQNHTVIQFIHAHGIKSSQSLCYFLRKEKQFCVKYNIVKRLRNMSDILLKTNSILIQKYNGTEAILHFNSFIIFFFVL